MRRTLPMVLLLLAGCEASPEALPAVATADTGHVHERLRCGSSAPEWGFVDAALFYSDEGPRLTVLAVPTDADGGLHALSLEAWGDRMVNGHVARYGSPLFRLEQHHGEPVCGPSDGDLFLFDLLLPEGGFTEGGVELAMRLVDADGNASDYHYEDVCLSGSDEGCADDG
jgi:hypothetical protein